MQINLNDFTHNPEVFYNQLQNHFETSEEYTKMLFPFCKHENDKIRSITFSFLGKQEKKLHMIPYFTEGLKDISPEVVCSVLEVIGDVSKEFQEAAQNITPLEAENFQKIMNDMETLKQTLNTLKKQTSPQTKKSFWNFLFPWKK